MNSGNYTISSTPVKYPYKAYPSQIGMIDRVIKALQRNQSCLIESPTGSGKSLALLCAVLAWRQNEFERVEKDLTQAYEAEMKSGVIKNSVFANELVSNSTTAAAAAAAAADESIIDLTADEDMDLNYKERYDEDRFVDLSLKSSSSNQTVSPKVQSSAEKIKEKEKPMTEEDLRDRIWEARKKIPKIYFGTRTHKQLSQLVRELKKTDYANVKMTILASRDQSCINETVRNQSDRGEACRQMQNPQKNYATGSCPFHSKWKKQYVKPYLLRGVIRREQQDPTNGVVDTSCGAWDIEDLVGVGRTHGFCPYYAASTTLIQDAELVFCPYNYLIDPLVRKSIGLDLKEQVIVFDEAHNIEDVCRDAASFVFTKSELEEAADDFCTAGGFDDYRPAKAAQFLEKVCRRLLLWLHEVTSDDKKMTIQSHQVQSREWQGQAFLDILAKLELLQKAGDDIRAALEEIGKDDDGENGEVYRRNPSGEPTDPVNIPSHSLKAMEKLTWFLTYFYKTEAFDYRICVKQEQVYDRELKTVVSLNFWCMNPATAFGDVGLIAKSVILASGTLAPMKTFETELGVPFKLQLEATHVLPKDRMFVASIAKGPTGRNLRVTYQNTSEYAFQDEIGQLLIDVCEVVPFGVLCFFPSYKLLEALCERWRSTEKLLNLASKKVIIVEPKISEHLSATMEKFYDAVKNPKRFGANCTGAIFLAVCRGKVSEGLDFADDNARAVVTIGIPYPNFNGLEIVHKRDYNNDRIRRGKSTLSGDQWYEIQAYRALNQALGRCLRHRQDWGALILVDERFGSRDSKRYCNNLSRWIRENIRHYDRFDKAISDLDTFTKGLVGERTELSAISSSAQKSDFASTSPPTTSFSYGQGSNINQTPTATIRKNFTFKNRSGSTTSNIKSPYFGQASGHGGNVSAPSVVIHKPYSSKRRSTDDKANY